MCMLNLNSFSSNILADIVYRTLFYTYENDNNIQFV